MQLKDEKAAIKKSEHLTTSKFVEEKTLGKASNLIFRLNSVVLNATSFTKQILQSLQEKKKRKCFQLQKKSQAQQH